jgi:hypothetical protein
VTEDSFKAAMDRMLTDATADLEARFLADHPDLTISYDTPPIIVHRHAAYGPASLDLLVDAGAITEAEAWDRGWTPPPAPSRRARLRWRWQAWRERAGRKLGGWIAGVDLSERDEDW